MNIDTGSDRVQLIHLSEAEYRRANFLDQRLLEPDTRTALVPWYEFLEASDGLPIRCHFIFHISHAGSTLMSRLLGNHSQFFGVREPLILRAMGQAELLDRMSLFLGLWSRTFHDHQTSMIKATSFVSELGPTLLEHAPHSKALLMYVQPKTFLAALLDGAMSDISSQIESRLKRLQKRGHLIDISASCLTPGESVAMSWLSEMRSLQRLATQFPSRTQWLDFDDFLNSPMEQLEQTLSYFGIRSSLDLDVARKTMQQYAKKTEVQYDSSFRTKLLQNAEYKFSAEIERGMRWLHRTGLYVGTDESMTGLPL